jgi:ketosteroid isomerase-like protein
MLEAAIMRTFLLISLLLLAGTTFAEGDRQQSKARAELDKAQAEYLAALLDADVAALARIWTEDYTFINGRGMLLSKDDRLKNIETGATELDSIKESGRQVRLYDDDTAVLTGTVTLEAKYSRQRRLWVYHCLDQARRQMANGGHSDHSHRRVTRYGERRLRHL